MLCYSQRNLRFKKFPPVLNVEVTIIIKCKFASKCNVKSGNLFRQFYELTNGDNVTLLFHIEIIL